MNDQDIIVIHGAAGEGGGQILRSCLALAIITGKPFRITHIRANRKTPGLRPQHLACVRAAAAISGAQVTGDEVGSRELIFAPGPVTSGAFHFDIGTAGSTTLVLQTVLPPLLFASGASRVIIEGGTHNPMAPPVEFLQQTFLPQLAKMGGNVKLTVERVGFYPVGGGRIVAEITHVSAWKPYKLVECSSNARTWAVAKLAKLPEHIAERELSIVQRKLRLDDSSLETVYLEADSPGNLVQVMIEHETIVETFTGFGQKAVPAETVATTVAREVQAYRRSKAPVGEHLADQLLLPMSIGVGGQFRTGPLTSHTTTNINVIQQFLNVAITTRQMDTHCWEVCVEPETKEEATHEIS